MNKNVFDYLNGKAHDVADYIKAKAEAAGNYISDHAQDIKNGAIKTTATLLTAATLMGGLTACDDTNTKDPSTQQTPPIHTQQPNIPNDTTQDTTEEEFNRPLYPIVTVRSREEIEESGITAEDVLNFYDNLCLRKVHEIQESDKELFGETWEYLSAQFECLNVNKAKLPISSDNGFPIYRFLDEPFYHNITEQGYCMKLIYNEAYRDDVVNTNQGYVLTPDAFDQLMSIFNIKPFDLTEEYWQENPTYADSYNHITGISVYPNFKFTRETILNANEEQLWALYNLGTTISQQIMNEHGDIEKELD